jgi:CRP/FNR family transcriptional regulator, cyclic AMP receptor protein
MISPEVLRRYPYFGGISVESLKLVAMLADEVSVAAGTQMFNEGDPAQYLYLILRGEVNIQYLLGTGELRTVDTLVDGDLLVWSAMIEPYKTTAVGTTTKATQLVRISAPKLRELCDKDPLLGYRLTIEVAKLLSHRLESARIQLAAAD